MDAEQLFSINNDKIYNTSLAQSITPTDQLISSSAPKRCLHSSLCALKPQHAYNYKPPVSTVTADRIRSTSIKSNQPNQSNQENPISPYQSFEPNQTKSIKSNSMFKSIQNDQSSMQSMQSDQKSIKLKRKQTSMNSYRQPLLKLTHGFP